MDGWMDEKRRKRKRGGVMDLPSFCRPFFSLVGDMDAQERRGEAAQVTASPMVTLAHIRGLAHLCAVHLGGTDRQTDRHTDKPGKPETGSYYFYFTRGQHLAAASGSTPATPPGGGHTQSLAVAPLQDPASPAAAANAPPSTPAQPAPPGGLSPRTQTSRRRNDASRSSPEANDSSNVSDKSPR